MNLDIDESRLKTGDIIALGQKTGEVFLIKEENKELIGSAKNIVPDFFGAISGTKFKRSVICLSFKTEDYWFFRV